MNPNIKCFSDLLVAKNQNLLAESIILACGVNEQTSEIETPSEIPHFKALIQHCVVAEYRIHLEMGEKLDSHGKQVLKAFKILHNRNFKSWLGTEFRRPSVRNIALKIRQLQSTEDVCKFT